MRKFLTSCYWEGNKISFLPLHNLLSEKKINIFLQDSRTTFQESLFHETIRSKGAKNQSYLFVLLLVFCCFVILHLMSHLVIYVPMKGEKDQL